MPVLVLANRLVFVALEELVQLVIIVGQLVDLRQTTLCGDKGFDGGVHSGGEVIVESGVAVAGGQVVHHFRFLLAFDGYIIP